MFESLPSELAESDIESDDSYKSVGAKPKSNKKMKNLYFPISNRGAHYLSSTFDQYRAGIQYKNMTGGVTTSTPVGIFPGPPKVPNRGYAYQTYFIHDFPWQHGGFIKRSDSNNNSSKYTPKGEKTNVRPITGLTPPNPSIPQQSSLKWKRPSTDMHLNSAATIRVDRGFRAHLGLSNSLKYFEKATNANLHEAKVAIDEILLTGDVSQELGEQLSNLSEHINKAHTIGEQLDRIANDNLSLATDQFCLWTMLERDKWLAQLPKDVSMETLTQLRTSDFHDGTLFPHEQVVSAAEEIKSRMKEEVDQAAHIRDAAFLSTQNSSNSNPSGKKLKTKTTLPALLPQILSNNPYKKKRNRGKKPAAAAGAPGQFASVQQQLSQMSQQVASLTAAAPQAPNYGLGRGIGRGLGRGAPPQPNPYKARGRGRSHSR